MTAKQLYETFFTAVSAAAPAVSWQQKSLPKPDSEPWGIVTFDGDAPTSLSVRGRSFIYYHLWIYKDGDESDLVQLAANIKSALNGMVVTSPTGGHKTVFDWISTGKVFYDETLLSDGIDMVFRNVASSI